ncbi:MAG: DnaD domain protein [Clostridia bacterium]|nr:DnaD domain protein [Clostridia bacterium]
MEYKIDFGRWNSVFAVPCDFVDNYIQKLSGIDAKVLLYMLRSSGKSVDLHTIASYVGESPESVHSSLCRLCDFGIVAFDGEKDVAVNKNDSSNCNLRKPHEVKYNRPSAADIAKRVENSKEMYFMMQESQVVLGRPLSSGDSSVLMALHDNDGLPADVILMLLQYAVSVGKTNMRYISKIGISWAESGIDDVRKAEKKIEELNVKNLAWRNFESIIGIDHRAPTETESEAVSRWINDWRFDENMIKEAYERCVNMNGKYVLKYMDSIIKRWHNQGIVNIEQAVMENKKRGRKKYSSERGSSASYSIEEYENYNILDYID